MDNLLHSYRKVILSKIRSDIDLSFFKEREYLAYFNEKSNKRVRTSPNQFIRLPYYVFDKLYKIFQNKDRVISLLAQEYRIGFYANNIMEIFIEDLDDFLIWFQKITDNKCKIRDLIITDKSVSEDIIIKYSEYIDFRSIHAKNQVTWNFRLIEKLKDKISWDYMSSYSSLDWNPENLKTYTKYISKAKTFFSASICIDWNVEVIDSIVEEWDWDILSANAKVGWTSSKLKKFEKYINFKKLSKNTNVEWNLELINFYVDKWDWGELSSNTSVKWNTKMVSIFYNFIDFTKVSSNTGVIWDLDLLLKFKDQLNWKRISINPQIPWSFELLEALCDKLVWRPLGCNYFHSIHETRKTSISKLKVEENASLSINEGINWTLEIIEKWYDKIDFWLIARLVLSDKYFLDLKTT